MTRKTPRAKLELGKLALNASFSEENYEDELAKYIAKLKEKRRKEQENYEKYSGAFLKLREEKLGALQRKIFATLGINIYETVKDAMSDRENVEVLNTTGSFDILFEEPEASLKKLLAALEKDAGLVDLIKAAINDGGGGEEEPHDTPYVG